MAFNSRLTLRLAVALVLFSRLLYAQEGGYFLDTSGDQPRFFQRLYWFKEEYALFYEVAIQINDGEYRDFMRESTEDTFITVSLPPGKYRYGVIPRDLLGQTGEMSEWRLFEIFPAFQPSIEKFYPHVFFLNERLERVLDIAGNNLLDESEIYLRGGDSSLFPIGMDVWGGRRAKLFFDDEKLIPGTYDIFIRNPGGVETSVEGFTVKYKSPVSFFTKFSWTPMIPLYGDLYNIFGSNFFMAGVSLNLGAVSSKRSSFNGGMEVTLAGHILNPILHFQAFNKFQDNLQDAGTGASWFEVNFNILLQKQFLRRRMAVTFLFGFGVSSLTQQGEYVQNELIANLNLGLSYMLLVYDIFYIEAGAGFSHYSTLNFSGFIKPRLGVGWQF